MLGLDYFCKQVPEGKYCSVPMRELPEEVAELIQETGLGGAVLFASNFQSLAQSTQLTYDLQQASLTSLDPKPFLIAVDQEGGRVVRLPRHLGTSFSGNMAIGATYSSKGTYYAQQVGKVLGQELEAVGINVNFAPTLDVNYNPENPVINIRSFGSDPTMVGDLGVAMVRSIQESSVAAAVKHFPGHGDTAVDSHTGLPMVDRPIEELLERDLKPFQMVIEQAAPAMVMTAHIQYPQIDSSTLIGLDGEAVIRPATMSKAILTDLLRSEMGYDGIIVTDALTMKGISNFFDPVQAVVETFNAGSDIALMPFLVNSPDDIPAFKLFIRAVAKQLEGTDLGQFERSMARIDNIRSNHQVKDIAVQLAEAKAVVGKEAHRIVEWQLANHAITMVKNNDQLPWIDDQVQKVQLLVDDPVQGKLIKQALLQYWPMRNTKPPEIEVRLWQELKQLTQLPATNSAWLAVVDHGYRSPVIEKGESPMSLEDKLSLLDFLKKDRASQPLVLVAMQSPYDLMGHLDDVDAAVAAYHSIIYESPEDQHLGISYQAIAAMITGINEQGGHLPVCFGSE